MHWLALAAATALAVLACAAAAVAGDGGRSAPCLPIPSDPGYQSGLLQALAQKRDEWGDQLLAAPGGPSYDAVRAKLHPLFLVGRPAGLRPKRLTDSGVYYLAFGVPGGPDGAGRAQLHVADGSQIVSQVADGRRLTVSIGRHGKERYGSCFSRLATPALAEGYQPVLETAYTDADGVRYAQESFAARIPQTKALVSFVRLAVDPTGAKVGSVRVRFTPNFRLRRVGRQLRRGRRTWAVFGTGGRFDGHSLVFKVRRPTQLYVAWLNRGARVRPFRLDDAAYAKALASVEQYWDGRLAAGAQLVVPEQRVYDAERSLLIQNLELSWRYSLGNPYERFSWELPDVAEVMGAYGYKGVERAIAVASLRAPTVFPNRSAGERMVASADYFRRYGDTAYVDRVTPRFRRDVQSFVHQLDGGTRSLLRRERYGADILGPIYGLHGQALALQGLRAMADVWARTGRPNLAAQASQAADRLGAGLSSAVAAAQVALPDGSMFWPIALVDGTEHPYDALTSSKRGSYWNLVMPYVLASGFVRPHSAQADGLLAYLLNHGSRFLGLVRFSPHTGVINPGYQKPGTDDVYGINVARFLADEDQPDQLVLSLYGKLAAGMTENTFVAGEGSTVLPTPGQYYRWMFRPPNSANNAFFLETLRLMLVHETTDAGGLPTGLELAYSTPRDWLAPGKQIAVRNLQTRLGPLSYEIDAAPGSVHAAIDLPSGFAGTLHLRLRLPAGERLGATTVNGAAFHSFLGSETLDLTGASGHVEVSAKIL
ncbi:MAG TPA: hypothetical protein VFJ75_11225 [Gaiellaceae bacterium]|nr:hypothetical protein [Gaiellaceae bacterium]